MEKISTESYNRKFTIEEYDLENEKLIAILKKEIQKGIDSGIAEDYDPVLNLEKLKKRRRKIESE